MKTPQALENPPKMDEKPGRETGYRPKISPRDAAVQNQAAVVHHKRPLHKQLG